ncbi:hypothetical protein C8R45DRAFT_930428 [Mycena sanguinolenta]|nr:hypothetical protein C8R45DRAFT_930428 [Mycena sanguinolenta]
MSKVYDLKSKLSTTPSRHQTEPISFPFLTCPTVPFTEAKSRWDTAWGFTEIQQGFSPDRLGSLGQESSGDAEWLCAQPHVLSCVNVATLSTTANFKDPSLGQPCIPVLAATVQGVHLCTSIQLRSNAVQFSSVKLEYLPTGFRWILRRNMGAVWSSDGRSGALQLELQILEASIYQEYPELWRLQGIEELLWKVEARFVHC